ncbi:hypothetical protein LTR56_021558 [Elasticomyces elasticus]|nr:hypothetical protein LTR56_021558 [Elasticomyces elasticus]KAK4926762.1 hypothetical protein LTR49_006444 [Elasticomyces elasticus]KAK5741410.1 hypothetical protein LTS12_024609 [Elasticomyces elasticus]
MYSRQIIKALSSAEKQLLHQQWQRSGKCIRCFHATVRRRAEDENPGQQSNGNDEGTPYNKPQRGPTRHQRSAQISEEVRALNRDVPSLGPSKPQNDDADFAVGPYGVSEVEIPGRMGENQSPGREGPYNQGAGRVVRAQDDVELNPGHSQHVRGVRTTEGKTEEPIQGGAAVLMEQMPPVEASPAEEQQAAQAGRGPAPIQSTARRGPRVQPAGTPFQPREMSMEDLTTSGNSASTIAAKNFAGVVADRIHIAAEPGELTDGPRDLDQLAHKLLSRQITHFRSAEEKEAVVAKVKEIMHFEQDLTPQQLANRDPEKLAQLEAEGKRPVFFRPLPEAVRTSLVDKMVKGIYDSTKVLGGEKHKQPVLNTVVRMTTMNSTYLTSDSERFLKKVKSLLPIAIPPRSAAAAQKAAKK